MGGVFLILYFAWWECQKGEFKDVMNHESNTKVIFMVIGVSM